MKKTFLALATVTTLVLILSFTALYIRVLQAPVSAFDQMNQIQSVQKTNTNKDAELHATVEQNAPVITQVSEPKKDEVQLPSAPEQTAQPQSEPAADIGKETALQIALDHAGLTKADVQEIEIEIDRERGSYHYDVEFHHKAAEHEYEIHPITGKILKAEVER